MGTEDEEMNNEMNMNVGGGRRRRKQTRKMKKSRKSNNALKEWVRFVKKVRAEEKIDSYKKAMSRAKVRADKGEKWRSMKGGEGEELVEEEEVIYGGEEGEEGKEGEESSSADMDGGLVLGGKRRRRRRTRARSKSMRRSRRRSSRRH